MLEPQEEEKWPNKRKVCGRGVKRKQIDGKKESPSRESSRLLLRRRRSQAVALPPAAPPASLLAPAESRATEQDAFSHVAVETPSDVLSFAPKPSGDLRRPRGGSLLQTPGVKTNPPPRTDRPAANSMFSFPLDVGAVYRRATQTRLILSEGTASFPRGNLFLVSAFERLARPSMSDSIDKPPPSESISSGRVSAVAF